MSLNGNLLEIPRDLMDVFKIYPEVRFIYYRAANTREEPKIESISKLSISYKEIIKELYPDYSDRHKVREIWSLEDFRSVLRYKSCRLEEYLSLIEYIPKIVEYGKISNHLELGRTWDLLNFLFSGTNYPDRSEYIIWGKAGLGINLIRSGQLLEVDDLESVHYLDVAEVKNLAELIQDFGDEIVFENLKRVIYHHKEIYWISRYRVDFQDESWILIVEGLCNSLKNFYFEVAKRENAVFISIN
jgi:hypothetical protein